MTCTETRDLLDAHADGELPRPIADAVADHLTTCPACAAEFETTMHTIADAHERLPRHRASDVLRARVQTSLRAASITPSAVTTDSPLAASAMRARHIGPLVRTVAAALLLVVVGGASYVAGRRATDAPPSLALDLETSHVRSLQSTHLYDVESTDQHTVKPWFTGKLDFSPPVPRLDEQGFPLVGGRLDDIAERRAAAIVYKRRQHVINLYVWPSRFADDAAPREESVRGFHIVRWREGGLEAWAISDVNVVELRQFATLVRESETPAATH